MFRVAALLLAAPVAATQTPNTYTYYSWPDGVELQAVQFSIEVLVDPGRSANTFWSNQFDLQNGGTAYTGMQSNGIGKPRTFLFSVWEGSAAKPGAPGTVCEPFNENGKGRKCSLHADWREGQIYKFNVAHEGGGWFGVTVTEMIGGTSFKLGSVLTSANSIATGNMMSWTEYFEWNFDTATCFNQPYSRARILWPIGNGKVIAGVDHTEASGDSKKPGACRSHVTVQPEGSIQANALGNSLRGPIKNGAGSCLDAYGGGNPGTAAISYGCNGQDNQAWVFGANAGLQLSADLCVVAKSPSPGSPATIDNCNGSAPQRWRYIANTLRPETAELCLTAHGDAAQLTLEPCAASTAQRWAVALPPDA